MSEPKPFASLSSGLLARKGAARPAMRPQGFGQAGAGLEDLGWNDMGFEAPKATTAQRDDAHDAFGDDIVEHPRALHSSGLTPVQSPVHDQQASLADRLGTEVANEDEEFDETAEPYDPDAMDDAVMSDDIDVDTAVEDIESSQHAPIPSIAVVSPAPAPRRRGSRARSAVGSKGKAAFTLRLDPERHLKLRLACAVDGRSAQMIVTAALDQMLSAMPELDAMASKANRKG